jgi:hypothetical protein
MILFGDSELRGTRIAVAVFYSDGFGADGQTAGDPGIVLPHSPARKA